MSATAMLQNAAPWVGELTANCGPLLQIPWLRDESPLFAGAVEVLFSTVAQFTERAKLCTNWLLSLSMPMLYDEAEQNEACVNNVAWLDDRRQPWCLGGPFFGGLTKKY